MYLNPFSSKTLSLCVVAIIVCIAFLRIKFSQVDSSSSDSLKFGEEYVVLVWNVVTDDWLVSSPHSINDFEIFGRISLIFWSWCFRFSRFDLAFWYDLDAIGFSHNLLWFICSSSHKKKKQNLSWFMNHIFSHRDCDDTTEAAVLSCRPHQLEGHRFRLDLFQGFL